VAGLPPETDWCGLPDIRQRTIRAVPSAVVPQPAVRAADRAIPGGDWLALAKRLEQEAGRRGGARWVHGRSTSTSLLLGNAVIDLPGS